jgi:hypothetical protein
MMVTDELEQLQRVLEQVAGSKYLNTVQDQNCSFSIEQQINKESMRMKTAK